MDFSAGISRTIRTKRTIRPSPQFVTDLRQRQQALRVQECYTSTNLAKILRKENHLHTLSHAHTHSVTTAVHKSMMINSTIELRFFAHYLLLFADQHAQL